MGFTLPTRTAEPTEKVRISVPLSIHSWASDLAEKSGLTHEEVLQEAVAYAFKSARKPAKPSKGKKAPAPQVDSLSEV